MNSEEKIYSKIKNASHKGEKDFPGMDKVWNRVEEKLDNTLVVQKKNTWQKVAIAATILLSFSIIYQFINNEETFKGKIKTNEVNSVIVSNDSVQKIIEKAKQVVVDHNTTKKQNEVVNPLGTKIFTEITAQPQLDTKIDDSPKKMELKSDIIVVEDKKSNAPELNKNSTTENEVSLRNSALNTSSSTNSYLVKGKKYDAQEKEVKSKYRAKSANAKIAASEKNDDVVVIDGVVKDQKTLDLLNAEDYELTHLKKPLYLINGVEYTEESLFGKKPTSPYAPLDKQEIVTINIIKDVDAMKIYGKKGENGIVIITTKDGKPAKN